MLPVSSLKLLIIRRWHPIKMLNSSRSCRAIFMILIHLQESTWATTLFHSGSIYHHPSEGLLTLSRQTHSCRHGHLAYNLQVFAPKPLWDIKHTITIENSLFDVLMSFRWSGQAAFSMVVLSGLVESWGSWVVKLMSSVIVFHFNSMTLTLLTLS